MVGRIMQCRGEYKKKGDRGAARGEEGLLNFPGSQQRTWGERCRQVFMTR